LAGRGHCQGGGGPYHSGSVGPAVGDPSGGRQGDGRGCTGEDGGGGWGDAGHRCCGGSRCFGNAQVRGTPRIGKSHVQSLVNQLAVGSQLQEVERRERAVGLPGTRNACGIDRQEIGIGHCQSGNVPAVVLMGIGYIMVISVTYWCPLVLIGNIVFKDTLELFLFGPGSEVQGKAVNGVFPFGIVSVVIGDIIVDMRRRNGVMVVVVGSESASPVESGDAVFDNSEKRKG